MTTDILKNDIQQLATAQAAFELEGWVRTGAIQRDHIQSNSLAYGTIYEKGDKKFYLNINSAAKALQVLGR